MATKTTTVKKTTTPSVASVKATQTALNQKGANLKVDGILGPKTQAAINTYGNATSSSSSKSTAPVSSSKSTPKATIAPKATVSSSSKSKSSGSTSYATPSTTKATTKTSTSPSPFKIIGDAIGIGSNSKVVKIKQPIFANPFDGGFLNNLKGGLKALPGDIKNSFSGLPFRNQSAAVLNARVGENMNSQDTVNAYKTLGVEDPYQAAYADKNVGNSQTSNALEATQGPEGYTSNLNPDVLTPGASVVDTSIPKPSSGSSSGTVDTKIVTPMDDGSTATRTFSEGPATPIINTQAATNVSGLVDDYMKTGGAATWASDKGEFQKNETLKLESSIANQFTSPSDVSAQYNNNPAFQASINKAAGKAGTTPQQLLNNIASKVTTATNGLTAPKTTAEFLAYNKNVAKEQTNLMNEQIAQAYNMNQQAKDILLGKKDAEGNDIIKGIVQQEKEEKDRQIEFYERQEARAEKSVKEKAEIAIDKARAEFESKDAEIELKRLQAKENLVNFLAHIGALNTDGNALLGIEKLEQAYQAQRQSLRSDFMMQEREIRADMNDRMYQLQDSRDEKVFKLNQDLSKTEREVLVETMKLDNELNKDLLKSKIDYYEVIQKAKDKAEAKSEANYTDNIEKIRLLMAGGADYVEASKLVAGKNYANDSKSLTRVNQLLGKKDSDQEAIAVLQELDDALKEKPNLDLVAAKKIFLQKFPNQSALFNSYVGN